MTAEFNDFGLHPQLLQAIEELGYSEPTPIQAGVITSLLNGKDVIGQAQTGTGKTAAFSLPILHNIQPKQKDVQALVMAPTRELAMQVAKAMEGYGRYRQVRVLPIYGGASYGMQKGSLRRGVDVVVGTPGRMLDLIKQGSLDLSCVNTVVLDEADEMLSMGFIEDIELILDELPQQHQTCLFSATMPQEIRKLAAKYMVEPESVTIKRKELTVDAIEQRYYLVREEDKLSALTRLFEVEDISRCLIFAKTRAGTGDLASELSLRGFPAEVLNGDLSQDAREQVMRRFRRDQIKVMVATDVAARGLDIDGISHVFNFDLPSDPEVYVHRVGRTGRAGATGIAATFLTPKEMWRLRRIEKYTRKKIEKTALPTVQDIQDHREKQLMDKMDVWIKRGRCSREKELINGLIEAGHDPVTLAAIALKLARAEEKQRPIPRIDENVSETSRDSKRRGDRRGRRSEIAGRRSNGSNGSRNGNGRSSRKAHEKGMVRLIMNAGKADGVRPNDVVGTIAYHAQIPGSTIGAIKIHDDRTMVDVPERFVSQVIAKSDKYQIHRQNVKIEKA